MQNTQTTLIRFDIEVNDDELAIVQAILVKHIQYGWEEENLPSGDTLVRVHIDNKILSENLISDLQSRDIKFEQSEIVNQDWQAAWKEFFTPVEVESFVVVPTWLAHADYGNLERIIIEPKSAFGTGHHATTVLCLEALSKLLEQDHNLQSFFDIGTGSGILSIAAAKKGLSGLAVDIDPLAIDNTTENITINQVQSAVEVKLGSVEQGKKYDLVLANILAGTLCELSENIMDCLSDHSYLILSGILNIQAQKVQDSYAKLGECQVFALGDWVALVYKKSI